DEERKEKSEIAEDEVADRPIPRSCSGDSRQRDVSRHGSSSLARNDRFYAPAGPPPPAARVRWRIGGSPPSRRAYARARGEGIFLVRTGVLSTPASRRDP